MFAQIISDVTQTGHTGNFLFNENSTVYSNDILIWNGTQVKSSKNILCDQSTTLSVMLQNLPAIQSVTTTQIIFNYPPSLFDAPYNMIPGVYTNKIRVGNTTAYLTAGVDYYAQCPNAQSIIIRADTNPSSPILNHTGITSVVAVQTSGVDSISKTEISGGLVTLTDNTSIMKISPAANYWFFSNTSPTAMTKVTATPMYSPQFMVVLTLVSQTELERLVLCNMEYMILALPLARLEWEPLQHL